MLYEAHNRSARMKNMKYHVFESIMYMDLQVFGIPLKTNINSIHES